MSDPTQTAIEPTKDSPPPVPDTDAPATSEDAEDARLWDEIEAAEAAKTAGEEPDAAAPPEGGAAEAPAGEAADEATDKPQDERQDDRVRDERGRFVARDAKEQPDAGKETPPADVDRLLEGAAPELRAHFDELKRKNEHLEQSDRSQRGRLSVLTRQIQDLSRQPSAPESSGAAAKASGSAGAEVFVSEEWKTFEKEYPELAAPMKKVVGAMQLSIADQGKVVDAIRQDRINAELRAELEVLETQHADWQEYAASKGFVDWVNSQPRYVQEAAQRNADKIVDGREAADMIGRYKAFRSAQTASETGGKPGPSQEGKTGSLSQRRQRQLESASGARSSGPGASHGIPEDGDPQALWDAFEREDARRELRRA